MAGRSTILEKHDFGRILHAKLSKISNSNTAPEAEGLPLNTPSKGIVDQGCLINYAGCDENLKCAGYWTLR